MGDGSDGSEEQNGLQERERERENEGERERESLRGTTVNFIFLFFLYKLGFWSQTFPGRVGSGLCFVSPSQYFAFFFNIEVYQIKL